MSQIVDMCFYEKGGKMSITFLPFFMMASLEQRTAFAILAKYYCCGSPKSVILERFLSLSMSMESIGAKIAFVRRVSGAGEMQKEITI